MARIDDADRRILTKKFELGLFEQPADRPHLHRRPSAAPRTARWPAQAVRESQVLLKNDGNVLPLAKTGGKIFVAGKNADNIGNQSGGWTITWQGARARPPPAPRSCRASGPPSAPARTVTYNATGAGIDSSYRAAIAVVGETPYAEGAGRPARRRWAWTPTDLSTLSTLRGGRRAGGGRAGLRAGRWTSPRSCPTGTRWSRRGCPAPRAHGVADVLFGDYAPTGKLPVTWMQQRQPAADQRRRRPAGPFPYGFGLTY